MNFCFDSNYPALNSGQTVGNLSGQQQQQHGPKSSSGNPGNIGQPHYQAPAAAGANQPFLQQQQHGMHALALPNASSYANSPAGVASTAIQYNSQRQLSQNGVIVFHTHTHTHNILKTLLSSICVKYRYLEWKIKRKDLN